MSSSCPHKGTSLLLMKLVMAGAIATTAYWYSSLKASSTNDDADDSNDKMSPTQLLSVMQHRRSIFPKQYSKKQVPRSIVEEMLEAAKWAPSHKLTQPWSFVVLESAQARKELGQLLAEGYKKMAAAKGVPFHQAKYDKKLTNATKSSYVIAIVCRATKEESTGKLANPWWEEICATAMAVQNMLLVAAAHNVGAYWGSGGVDGPGPVSPDAPAGIQNAGFVRDLLNLQDHELFLGWIFVGDFFGDTTTTTATTTNNNATEESKKSKYAKQWPASRREDLQETGRLVWK
eukprot:Nitzschia sp. Nitz4//scaffold116_size91068//80984//81949//NITZ4_004969-RA/size91068-augustus-gene-0.62-mRNA-1//-1//CDS//3329533611//3013//frame0